MAAALWSVCFSAGTAMLCSSICPPAGMAICIWSRTSDQTCICTRNVACLPEPVLVRSVCPKGGTAVLMGTISEDAGMAAGC